MAAMLQKRRKKTKVAVACGVYVTTLEIERIDEFKILLMTHFYDKNNCNDDDYCTTFL